MNTVLELKEKLKAVGLNTHGRKQELVERLATFNVKNMVKEKRLKSKSKFETDNLLTLCAYCKCNLSSQQYGKKIEKFIKEKLIIRKAINNTSGDGIFNDKNVEIKVSLGDDKQKFNFVQIRPDHNIDNYILIIYSLFVYIVCVLYIKILNLITQ